MNYEEAAYKEVDRGDIVILMTLGEIVKEFEQNEYGEFVFDTVDCSKEMLSLLDDEKNEYVLGDVDDDGDFKIKGLNGTYPKEIVKEIVEKRHWAALKYYRAQSEIEGTTSKYKENQVFLSKEACQEEFPDSNPVLLEKIAVEFPSFIDIPMIKAKSKNAAKAFMQRSICCMSAEDVTDELRFPKIDSDYVRTVYDATDPFEEKEITDILIKKGGTSEEAEDVLSVFKEMKDSNITGVFVISWDGELNIKNYRG